MQGFDVKYALFKILTMVTSRKFLALLFAALVASGLNISDEWQSLIYLAAAGLFAAFTAYEDSAE